MAEEKVRKPLALLEQAGAGPMDLVWPEALGPLHPPRRASAGVAAAVMSCSPRCAARTVAQVRRGGWGKGGPGRKGAAWAAGGARKVGPAWAGTKGNPRRAEGSRSALEEWGGVKGNEPGAACSAHPGDGRGGGEGPERLGKEGNSLPALTKRR
ncbi:hypothetical protein NDU88_002763 [Pleurodeles waltl]|uniref:Uncharacterized protein n=1 Tax=Pleurodeles waltl TaxID=8319 RepID=A0AAV7WTB4_PLEWA|nr:hypothetical protein NDU88_002763 [Pleurodeles waltl]